MGAETVSITQKIVFGPAMTALTAERRAFVIAFNNAGGSNAAEAARAAGFKDSNFIRQQAYHLLHDERIQAAIREDVIARLSGNLAETFNRIDAVAKNTQHPKQLDALKFQAHHAGMLERTVVQHEGTVTLTFDQKCAELAVLARAAGDDPDEVLREIKDVSPQKSGGIDVTEPEAW